VNDTASESINKVLDSVLFIGSKIVKDSEYESYMKI